MSTQPPSPPALLSAADELAVWGCGPEAGLWAREQMVAILARHWPATTPAPAPAPLLPATLAELKSFLHGVVDRLELPEPEPVAATPGAADGA